MRDIDAEANQRRSFEEIIANTQLTLKAFFAIEVTQLEFSRLETTRHIAGVMPPPIFQLSPAYALVEDLLADPVVAVTQE
jgi:hypothetical protein